MHFLKNFCNLYLPFNKSKKSIYHLIILYQEGKNAMKQTIKNSNPEPQNL